MVVGSLLLSLSLALSPRTMPSHLEASYSLHTQLSLPGDRCMSTQGRLLVLALSVPPDEGGSREMDGVGLRDGIDG